MKTIGLRELQQHASVHVRAAAAGERICVTDRGRPVAWLVPNRPSGPSLLRASGRVREAKRSLPDEPPLPRREGDPSLSDVLREARHDER